MTKMLTYGGATAVALAMCSLGASAQGNWDGRRNMYTRLEPGMTIQVRVDDEIGASRTDYRVYRAIVEQDVFGDNNRLAIPRGSAAELIVRSERDGDLILDLESVTVNGQRYAIDAGVKELSGRDRSLIGSIVGAIPGVETRGRAVRIPRGAVMGFRLDRSLVMGVADRGITRDGRHYHDYYGRERR